MSVMKQFLEDKGYNVVALPKTSIKPLMLLEKNGKELSNLGNKVEKLFEEDEAPLPVVELNETVPDLEGQSELTFGGKAGFVFLSGLLSKWNLGNAYSKAEFSDTDKVVFSFKNVLEDRVSGMLDLDAFIAGSIPKVDKFRSMKKRLEGSKLFIITATLKCNEFSIKVVDKNNKNISGSLKVDNAAATTAEIKHDEDTSLNIKYKGDENMVIGVKAVQILCENRGFFSRGCNKGFSIKSQVGMVVKSEEDFPVDVLKLEGDSNNIINLP